MGGIQRERFGIWKDWNMASQSRKAQEQLAELEKLSAPFEDQLVEAAKFVGVDLETISRQSHDLVDDTKTLEPVQYFGREEWLLRWLLKQLLVPRKTASAWSLLLHLLRTVPIINAAKILAEKKFVSTLRSELEQLVKDGQDVTAVPVKEEKKSSKKRKRSGEVIASSTTQDAIGLSQLLESIYETVRYITEASDIVSSTSAEGNGRGTALSAEYMQKAIRTSPIEAAQVLGSWMVLCKKALSPLSEGTNKKQLLLPFTRIWSCHTTDTTAYLSFSLHCTQPLLAILKVIKGGLYPGLGWTSQLEQLIARNIINPAKSAMAPDQESDLLSALTDAFIIQDISAAPHIFEVAIRSIKPHGSRRRRASDDAWLLHVFKTLRKAMPFKASKDGKAISDMLQLAIQYKVMLDLPVLRAITLEFALHEGNVSWQLVATMIKLDSNVFLIPDDESESNLLDNLLTRITNASVTPDWPEISRQVVSEVVVPLLNEFAKARDLSGFMKHWHAQLIEFEKLRSSSEDTLDTFSAWEDDALHVELRRHLEVSLTIQQIEQILSWLSSEVNSTPDAVCVLLDAVAGSLISEAVIDTVGLRPYHIMFDQEASLSLTKRYKWRSLRMVSHLVDCMPYVNVDRIMGLWQQDLRPFITIQDRDYTESTKLDFVERVRLACAIWSAPESGNLKDTLVKPVLLGLLDDVNNCLQALIGEIKLGIEVSVEDITSELKTVDRSRGCISWLLIRSVFVEYPKTLPLVLELEEPEAILQNMFWLGSTGVFEEVWISALESDEVLNCSALNEIMIDIMLHNQTNHNNPILESASVNNLAVKALLKLRMESLNKKQRETILKGWLPTGDAEHDAKCGLSFGNAVNPAILSLKLKMMEYAMFYEGMDFEEFINLATALSEKEDPNKQVSLTLLKEFCRKTVEYVHTIPKEPRNKAYIVHAFKSCKKKIKKAEEKPKHKLTIAVIAIFEVVLKVLLHTNVAVIESDDLGSVVAAFKNYLLEQLKTILHGLRKGKISESQDSQLLILSIVDALTTLDVNVSDIEALQKDASKFIASHVSELNVGARLENFMFATTRSTDNQSAFEFDINIELSDGVKTVYGRQSIIQKAKILASGDNKQKLDLLKAIFGSENGGLRCPEKLLAARQVVISLEDASKSEDEASFDISEAYATLCGQILRTTSMVQFSIISEILQLTLQSKPRSISQYNIDTTLGSIAILCSRQGPPLNPIRANAIFTHCCHLFRSVIMHHRLKLQGHMHLVVQTLLSLLRCLFLPLPHSSTKPHRLPPPWLPTTSTAATDPSYNLTPASASHFTRLLTLLCDPSESSVRSKNHNILTSASEKWKRVTGWHMQVVLMEYVALQLEMRMDSGVREKLIPGVYAIFDTGSVELRRAVASRLDASQRAVFGALVRDWARFGKWKGA